MTKLKEIVLLEEIKQKDLALRLGTTHTEVSRQLNKDIDSIRKLKQYCQAINSVLGENKYAVKVEIVEGKDNN